MSNEDAQVKVRLVVDSNSEAAAEKMKKSLGGVRGAVKAVGAGTIAAGALMANVLAHVAAEAVHLGKEALLAPIEAFMESEKQVRALASTFATLSTGGATFEQLTMFASRTKDELEELGMAAGFADDELVAVFNNVIERGGKSVEQAKELTEQMAFAGRAIPGGAVALSEAMEQIEMGVVRAKNPIVGMIAATGMLKGNAKQVAKEMAGMSQKEQMELAEKAIGRMGDKMKNVPMTIGQSLTSLKVMAGNVLETAGEPMTAALSKAVADIRGEFFGNTGEATALTKSLMDGAKAFGGAMAQGVSVLGPFVTSFIGGITSFSEEFAFIWREVWGEGDGMMKQMKEVAIFSGKLLGQFIKGAAIALGVAVKGIQETLKAISTIVGMALKAAGELTDSQALAGAGQRAMNFAQQGDAEDILVKARKTGGGEKGDLTAQMDQIANITGDKSKLAELKAAFAERENMQFQVDAAQKQAADLTGESAAQYLAAFGNAAKSHDDAAMLNIARFLGSNEKMAQAIGKLAPDMIEGGVAGFVDTLKKAGNESMAKVIEGLQKKGFEKMVSPTVNQTFTGAITIKQDFKDEDPDRMIVLFKGALADAGVRPTQARGASPFGG